MRYRQIVWDWNGTLLDDIDLSVSVVNELLLDHDVPELSVARYRQIFDFPIEHYYRRAGLDLARLDFATLSHRFVGRFEALLHQAPLISSAATTLQALREQGVAQFLLSGTQSAVLDRMVARYDVHHFFDDVQGLPDMLARSKTEAGRTLMRRAGIDPATTLFVGDTRHDAEVAEALGADCALVSFGHQSAERLASLGWPVVDSLEDLVALVVD